MENEAIEIKKEGFFRVGMECGYLNSCLYIDKLGLEKDIANRVRQSLNLKYFELCDITSDIRKFLPSGRFSIAGGNYLSEKVLRLKLKIIIEEYELVDDAVREMKIQAPNMALFLIYLELRNAFRNSR